MGIDHERVQLDAPPVGVVGVHVQLERVPRAFRQAAGRAEIGWRARPVDVLETTILHQSNIEQVLTKFWSFHGI